jgi:site-specific DNA-methyltransferase (adenine-specific)
MKPIAVHGDMRQVLREMAARGVLFDSCVCDPPYHLSSIVKRFGNTSHSDNTQTSQRVRDRADGYARAASGFMSQKWDGGDISMQPETWKAVYDVLKPGSYLAAFGGTRTWHRIAVAIEDAGFEIRDTVMWLYSTGFPKAHNIEKSLIRTGYVDEAEKWAGFHTALKPSYEPIILARKPLEGTIAQNVLKHGVGGMNIEASRIPAIDKTPFPVGATSPDGVISTGLHSKPRLGDTSPTGRWPGNLIHDGSEEVEEVFAHYGRVDAGTVSRYFYNTGDGQRFHYGSKANKTDRAGSGHPTCKPINLMRYLARLITPPGGSIIDPFAGSGTTLAAAHAEGFWCVGVEQQAEYMQDILRRIGSLP